MDGVTVTQEQCTAPDGVRWLATDGTITVESPVVARDVCDQDKWRKYWTAAVQRGLRDVQAGRMRHVIEIAPNRYRVFSY